VACYALWVFALFGHKDLRILDGGRDKWIAEGRPVTKDKPTYPQTKYPVPAERDDRTIRAFFDDTLAHSKARKPLIDVRSSAEFMREITVSGRVSTRERASWWACSGGKECPVGNGSQRRRHIQIPRETRKDL